MRDSYEFFLLAKGEPIPILPRELTPDVRIIKATKNGLPYPVDKALTEVSLRYSSREYRALLRCDYEGLRWDHKLEDTIYVLFTDNMRTITVMHRTPYRTNDGKFIIYGENYHPCPIHLHGGITYAMLDRLLASQQLSVASQKGEVMAL